MLGQRFKSLIRKPLEQQEKELANWTDTEKNDLIIVLINALRSKDDSTPTFVRGAFKEMDRERTITRRDAGGGKSMDEKTKEAIIADVLECPICKKWLALCMVGRFDDMATHEKEKSSYWQEHESHLKWHENERAERLNLQKV